MVAFIILLLCISGLFCIKFFAVKKDNNYKSYKGTNKSKIPNYPVFVSKVPSDIIFDSFNWDDEDIEIKGMCYKLERLHPGPNEFVLYKSRRFADLFGRRGRCSYFPGYGKLNNRVFDIWYENVNSDEKNGLFEYKDVSTQMRGSPHFYEIEHNHYIYHELSRNKKGYLYLYKSDTRNKKTWYAGIKSLEFTGIIVKSDSGWLPEK